MEIINRERCSRKENKKQQPSQAALLAHYPQDMGRDK